MLAQHLIRRLPGILRRASRRSYFTYNGRRYRNHNRLLFGYKGTDGIKTGYTRAAGFNLTASVQRGDKHLVAVVLGGRTGSQRDAAMRALLDKNLRQRLRGEADQGAARGRFGSGIGRRGYRIPTCPTTGQGRNAGTGARPDGRARRSGKARPDAG